MNARDDVQTADVIRGINNGCFYFRSVDSSGEVHYDSMFGTESDWIVYALTKRPDDWEVSSHLSYLSSKYGGNQ